MICLGLCEKRLKILDISGAIFKEKEIGTDFEAGIVSDDIHYLIAENKIYSNYNVTPWFRKLQKQFKDISLESLGQQIRDILLSL